MKRTSLLVSVLAALVLCVYITQRHDTATRHPAPAKMKAAEGTKENPSARSQHEWMLLRHPQTNTIPKDIGTRQNAFVNRLAEANARLHHLPQVTKWTRRGPYNVGGRTKALAIDVKNENVILAGCVSSGMWKSTDKGKSWRKTTSPNQLPSVSCIVQNKKPGKENLWYYGTGEYSGARGGSAAAPLSTNGFYRGDGIFKSLDNGETWSQLPSTVSGTAQTTDPFDFIYKLLTFEEEGVLAATSSGVFLSSDGGASWKHVLDFGEKYPSSDIAITSQGTFYAAIDGMGTANGLYTSSDGVNWEDISPPDWPDTTTRTVIAIPPSNEKTIYVLTEVAHWKQTMKKYEKGIGWSDLTKYLPCNAEMTTYGANMMMLYVKPDDDKTLFLGTVGLYRSKDGGYSYDVIGNYSDFHVDQHAIAFFPSNPKSMLVGNDGGVFGTNDNMAAAVPDPIYGDPHIEWKSLNEGYITTQFYSVAIDHGTPGSELVLGGTQDNSFLFSASTDSLMSWTGIFPGAMDGGYCAISDGGRYFYTGQAASFSVYRNEFPNDVWEVVDVTPASAIGMGLWMNPLLLDPHDSKIMYLPSQRELWRNSDLTNIPVVFPMAPTDINWTKLVNVHTDWHISALGMSEAEPRRLYYGCIAGSLYRLDNPQEGQPIPVALQGNNIQWYGYRYAHCISVDPRNVNKLLVVFPEYETMSIYLSEDGGDNWTPVSGNLEENPDGSGGGPSVRWLATLYVKDHPVYFAGTSVGLFSTIKLDGMNTVWVQEGAEPIGRMVIDMIDVRQSDGYIAVATHGNGIYTAYLTDVSTSVTERTALPEHFMLHPAYPNPFNARTTIRFELPRAGMARLLVYNMLGQKVATLVNDYRSAGKHTAHWNAAEVASGEYILQLQFEKTRQTQKVVIQK